MANARSLEHEPDVRRVRALLIGGAAVLGVVAAVAIASRLLVHGLTPPPAAPRAVVAPRNAPALQPAPERDFPAFHREKLELLQEYAWVDRAHGVVRIPIDRAMALLVEQQARRRSAP